MKKKSPITSHLRIYIAIFIISAFGGVLISFPIRLVQARGIEKTEADIHLLESTRMNERVNQLKQLHVSIKNH